MDLLVLPAAVALLKKEKEKKRNKTFKIGAFLIHHPPRLLKRNVSSLLSCLELRGWIQQYSCFRVNQHYHDQLTGLTWLLWERAGRSHRITGSNCTYSDEVGSFSLCDYVKLFVPVELFSNSQVSLACSYYRKSHLGRNYTGTKILMHKMWLS